MFDPKAAGYRDPLLISATDGVGTKLKVAIAAQKHNSVGIDLVAMCVNDLVVQGAEPLFFLDYFATGKLEVEAAREIVAGIAAGCQDAGCALIGGETAEMPGLYQAGDYDLAGFAVGAVERDRLVTGERVATGDLVLGLASSGPHANGFSLIRKLVEALGLDYQAPAPFAPEASLAEALLTPTRIYVKSCLAALAEPVTDGGEAKALAHITGGGFPENLPRVLPQGLGVALDAAAWPLPPLFAWLAKEGGIPAAEMLRTFNCGIGMIAVVAPEDGERLTQVLEDHGETVYRIGEIVSLEGSRPVVAIANLEAAWGV